MPAVTARVTIEGADRAMELIAARADRMRDVAPAFEVIADLLEAHVAATWATQGARIGHAWRPLARLTIAQRTARRGYYRAAPAPDAGPTGPVLVWTGRSRASFRRGSAQHVREVSPSSLRWGSSRALLRSHQEGTIRLPRRPVLGFRDAWQQREIVWQPVRQWLQGVPAGTIRSVAQIRTRL